MNRSATDESFLSPFDGLGGELRAKARASALMRFDLSWADSSVDGTSSSDPVFSGSVLGVASFSVWCCFGGCSCSCDDEFTTVDSCGCMVEGAGATRAVLGPVSGLGGAVVDAVDDFAFSASVVGCWTTGASADISIGTGPSDVAQMENSGVAMSVEKAVDATTVGTKAVVETFFVSAE